MRSEVACRLLFCCSIDLKKPNICSTGSIFNMRQLNVFVARLALLVLHAAGAGLASPAILVALPASRIAQWLPVDNQTLYRVGEGETISLELNISSISQSHVFITINPCSKDLRWSLRHTLRGNDDHASVMKENSNGESETFPLQISHDHRYIFQLSSSTGSAAAISVRGEASRPVRMRLRVKSRRRLAANWDPSPIDPQATKYCVVASHRKNYTSLCAAQRDVKLAQAGKPVRLDCAGPDHSIDNVSHFSSAEVDNKVELDANSNVLDRSYKNVYRKRKFSRSTTVTDEDPVIACVGDRIHHLFDNLDQTKTYFVSLFGVAHDRRAGALLATADIKPKTSTARKLKENVPYKADIRGKNVFYFKATVETGGGIWIAVTTCGGAVDVEVVVKGKRLHLVKNVDPHSKFFVLAPILTSSVQESGEDSSVLFDSSSEEAKVRYVIKVLPSKWIRDGVVGIEVTASTSRWGMNIPELPGESATVRELRQHRSCRSVDIAFLPATHNSTEIIRYCISTRENVNGDNSCSPLRRLTPRAQCITPSPTSQTTAIVHKITNLRPGRKYAVRVSAASGSDAAHYNVLFVDTNLSCKNE